jgi:hypothetical protein
LGIYHATHDIIYIPGEWCSTFETFVLAHLEHLVYPLLVLLRGFLIPITRCPLLIFTEPVVFTLPAEVSIILLAGFIITHGTKPVIL